MSVFDKNEPKNRKTMKYYHLAVGYKICKCWTGDIQYLAFSVVRVGIYDFVRRLQIIIHNV